MILGIFVGFFVVAGVIAIPQFILKECGELTIRKSIIVRIIISFAYFALLLFLMVFFDSKDQGVDFFDYLMLFFKTYSVKYEEFKWVDIWYCLQDMKLYNNVVWTTILFFFPQLTLLIPKFLFEKYKEYAEYQEVAVTGRVAVSVDSSGNVSAREANIYNTIRPYLYKTVIAIIVSVAIFIPVLYAIVKYLSPVWAMLIVVILDIIILVLACVLGRKKQ